MAITGNSSYVPTINEFSAHWVQCNTALAPQALLVRLPDNTTRTQAQFVSMRNALEINQDQVQDCLVAQVIARANIFLRKEGLLAQLNLFNAVLDGYYQNTVFYAARPFVPSIGAGQENFIRPMVDAMKLWAKLNVGTAPEGVTLPLSLSDGTNQEDFADAVQALKEAYEEEQGKAQDVTLARATRDLTQDKCYETMKSYREAVPAKLSAFPALIETMPRLTPLPGHTPAAVNASAVFQAPNQAKVIYDASTDLQLERYELRGTVGDHYDEDDAVVIATHLPNEPREFVTTFGLNQPGAEIALKVFVVLTTGNEAGSAAMLVDRPANVELLAA
jgi:hypothetical protein